VQETSRRKTLLKGERCLVSECEEEGVLVIYELLQGLGGGRIFEIEKMKNLLREYQLRKIDRCIFNSRF